MKLIILVLTTLLISGCSSASIKEMHYYLLNQQTEMETNVDQRQAKTRHISLESIKLPEYLLQPYLVIQLREHQLHYATFHMWAENLQTGIAKSLVDDLNRVSGTILFDYNHQTLTQQESLVVEIDHFYPTENATVLLSGRFWLKDKKGQRQLQPKNFKFETELKKDGYPHSVAEMRKQLKQLSQYLSAEIDPR